MLKTLLMIESSEYYLDKPWEHAKKHEKAVREALSPELEQGSTIAHIHTDVTTVLMSSPPHHDKLESPHIVRITHIVLVPKEPT